MGKYAEGTMVPIVKTRIEIEELLRKHGARNLLSGDDGTHVWLAFAMKERFLKFAIPLPDPNAKEFTRDPRYSWKQRSAELAAKAVEAETRRRWRALLLALKAKFEVVQSGISTFEHEFLSNFMLPDKRTIGEVLVGDLDRIVTGGMLALPAVSEVD